MRPALYLCVIYLFSIIMSLITYKWYPQTSKIKITVKHKTTQLQYPEPLEVSQVKTQLDTKRKK